jgi:hypothetical protein
MKKGEWYMKKYNKPTPFIAVAITFAITYTIVRIIYKVTGFYYDFNEGLFNFKFLIDFGFWCIVYFTIDMFFEKIWNE